MFSILFKTNRNRHNLNWVSVNKIRPNQINERTSNRFLFWGLFLMTNISLEFVWRRHAHWMCRSNVFQLKFIKTFCSIKFDIVQWKKLPKSVFVSFTISIFVGHRFILYWSLTRIMFNAMEVWMNEIRANAHVNYVNELFICFAVYWTTAVKWLVYQQTNWYSNRATLSIISSTTQFKKLTESFIHHCLFTSINFTFFATENLKSKKIVNNFRESSSFTNVNFAPVSFRVQCQRHWIPFLYLSLSIARSVHLIESKNDLTPWQIVYHHNSICILPFT